MTAILIEGPFKSIGTSESTRRRQANRVKSLIASRASLAAVLNSFE